MEQNVIMAGEARPDWSEERVARLVVLWGRGLSAAAIAAELGPGFSRSAVVGKLVRIGLRLNGADRQAAQASGGRRARGRERHGPPMIPAAPTRPRACEVVPRLVSLTELLPGNCRWPCGEGVETRFCGHLAKPGGPYCAAHHAIAYFAVLPPLTLEALEARPAAEAAPSQARRDR